MRGRIRPLLATAAALSAALAAAAPGVAQQAPGASAADPERGRAVAAGAFDAGPGGACQSCHGIDGAGDAVAGFPRLAGLTSEYIARSLEAYASGERRNEIMTPLAQALTAEQILDVSAFYARTEGVMTPVAGTVAPRDLQTGAVLAAIGDSAGGVQACINCHGPEGRGTGYTFPALAGQSALYMEAQLRAYRDGLRTSDPQGVMRGIAGRLGEAQIAAVAAYYASLTPAEGLGPDTVSAVERDGGQP